MLRWLGRELWVGRHCFTFWALVRREGEAVGGRVQDVVVSIDRGRNLFALFRIGRLCVETSAWSTFVLCSSSSQAPREEQLR